MMASPSENFCATRLLASAVVSSLLNPWKSSTLCSASRTDLSLNEPSASSIMRLKCASGRTKHSVESAPTKTLFSTASSWRSSAAPNGMYGPYVLPWCCKQPCLTMKSARGGAPSATSKAPFLYSLSSKSSSTSSTCLSSRCSSSSMLRITDKIIWSCSTCSSCGSSSRNTSCETLRIFASADVHVYVCSRGEPTKACRSPKNWPCSNTTASFSSSSPFSLFFVALTVPCMTMNIERSFSPALATSSPGAHVSSSRCAAACVSCLSGTFRNNGTSRRNCATCDPRLVATTSRWNMARVTTHNTPFSDAQTTVAARGASYNIASSPKNSPGVPYSQTFFPLLPANEEAWLTFAPTLVRKSPVTSSTKSSASSGPALCLRPPASSSKTSSDSLITS
mmetsp:Transcript_31325/g.102174  ORF Transcript_31325/g.102174 Transcript_31325/m.102174 type:complete len:394 (+) Transcript_31325:1915-3096(+)